MLSLYKRYGKLWRLKHTAYRNEERKTYYAKHRTLETTRNEGQRWSKEEITLIMDANRPSDPELAKQLGRSVQAIQVKRTKLLRAKD